jgi:hypothetical protein
MFEFLRNLRKSDEEKTQEALTAYLDGALTPGEKRDFEQRLAADEALRADLEQQRLVKQSLGALPRLRAPRNFTLDPALYGRPQPAGRLYPALRTATVLAAILFVVLLSVDLVGTLGPVGLAGAPQEAEFSQIASEPEADLSFADEGEAAVEVTRVVEAEMIVEDAEEVIVEEFAAEAPAEEMIEEALEMEEAELLPRAPAEPDLGGQRASATPPPPVAEGEALPQDGVVDESAAAMQLPVTMTASPPPTPTTAPSPAAATALAEVPGAERAVVGDAATAEARALLSTTQAEPDAELAREGGAFDLPVMRLLAIVAGFAVLLLAGATFLLRRRL